MQIIDFQPNFQTWEQDPLCGAVPLTTDSAAKLLASVISRSKNERVVFDLDSTLLNNRPRNAKIMQQYGELHDVPELAVANSSHFVNWDTRHSMALTGLSPELVEKHVSPYQDYWLNRFFTSEYCHYDTDISGAMEFVIKVKESGGNICYLTGRDETMRHGTRTSLENLGFPGPDSDGVNLVMKPTRDYSDDLFKKEAMEEFRHDGGILAAFDNEPTHINSYRRAFPEAICVHLYTDHSMRDVQLLDGIYSVSNFPCDSSANEK